MQQVGSATRQALLKPATIISVQANTQLGKDKVELPEWLKEAEKASAQKPTSHSSNGENGQQHERCEDAGKRKVSGKTWKVYVGANLPLYATSEQETKLRNMHEPNHRELPISKAAVSWADWLWPSLGPDVDEAIAKSKEMQVTKRIAVDDEADEPYVPPEVPHFLPFTHWVRNCKEIRESFICDESTRYKPRMSWYNPNDGMVPAGWFSEGLLKDMAYYRPFGATRNPDQKW